ncbi:MAG: cobalamin biosynthesis central domain-containing protein, partial [Leptolyngbyaceae bacterium]|nr:cobalamin biosynthesis central domain-containing protein [Leptolyngbyaceae bacterium]
MTSSDVQSVAAIALTPRGFKTLQKLPPHLKVTLWVPPKLLSQLELGPPELSQQNTRLATVQVYGCSLKEQVAALWNTCDAMMFALATGAVVRLIAPLLSSKATDPAVLVVDDSGQFVLSLCGGHQQGGDRLSQEISRYLNAQAVVTGASSGLELPGVDVLGVPFGWTRGSGNWTGVSGAIARQEPVHVIQDAGSDLWQHHLSPHHSFQFGWPDVGTQHPAASAPPPPANARLWISPVQRRFSETEGMPKAQWHPRVLWVGVGCE